MIDFILKNIHTLILLAGLGLLMYGLFLFGDKVGFIASGLILIVLAIYVDSVGGKVNKRIKKKRKLETAIVLLIKEVAELRSIVSANAKATNNELAAVKSAILDNQVAIKSIGDEVGHIKQNYKRKWRK